MAVATIPGTTSATVAMAATAVRPRLAPDAEDRRSARVVAKIGVAIWSNDHPSTPFASLEVTDDVAATSRTVDIVGDYSGRARVAGYTVLHERRGTRGVLVLDVPGARTVAWTDDPELVASMERDEWIGREVVVEASCVVS